MRPGKECSVAAPVFRSIRFLASAAVVYGVLLSLENFGYLRGPKKWWPGLTLILGLGFIGLQRKRGFLPALGIGVYLCCFSALAFYCNYVGWNTLTSLWPVFIAFMGLSLSCCFLARRDLWVLEALGLALICLAMTFILIIEVGPRFWPVSLVLFGITCLAVERYANAESRDSG